MVIDDSERAIQSRHGGVAHRTLQLHANTGNSDSDGEALLAAREQMDRLENVTASPSEAAMDTEDFA